MSEHEEPRGCTALISDGVHIFRCCVGTADRCDRHPTPPTTDRPADGDLGEGEEG